MQEEHLSPIPFFWGHSAPQNFCTDANTTYPCPQGSGPIGSRGNFPSFCPPPPSTITPSPTSTIASTATLSPTPSGSCAGLTSRLLCSAALQPETFAFFCELAPLSDECRSVVCNCLRNHRNSCFQLCEIGYGWACGSLTATPPIPTPTPCPPTPDG